MRSTRCRIIQNDPSKIDEARRRSRPITRRLFARFLERLAATPDGDGTLLDHSIMLFGSNMSNSDLHNNDPLPLGGVRARLRHACKGGQHLQYPQDTPHANLLLTLLERAGVPIESSATAPATCAKSDADECRWPTDSSCAAGARWREQCLRRPTPLIDAAETANHGAVAELLEDGADVERAQNPTARRRCIWAAHDGDAELVATLLDAGADVNAANDYGATPMAEAAAIGDADADQAAAEGGRRCRIREPRRPDGADGRSRAPATSTPRKLLLEARRQRERDREPGAGRRR